MIIPTYLQIEPIRGCNAKCPMCPLWCAIDEMETTFGIMRQEVFEGIVHSFIPYTESIEYTSLWYLGEPLLDPGLFDKIKYLKKYGFRNVAISTNGALLDKDKQSRLLDTGIDTIIFSIDSIEKETYELIRKGLRFDQVMCNILSCMDLRNTGYKTRFIFRMVSQRANQGQWPDYLAYWQKQKGPNDEIQYFGIQNCVGTQTVEVGKVDYTIPCSMLDTRMIIGFDGDVILCCADIPSRVGGLRLGNVLESNPIELFNGEIFQYYRKMNEQGMRGALYLCRECNIPDKKQTNVVK